MKDKSVDITWLQTRIDDLGKPLHGFIGDEHVATVREHRGMSFSRKGERKYDVEVWNGKLPTIKVSYVEFKEAIAMAK